MSKFIEENMESPEYKLRRMYKALAQVTADDSAHSARANNLLHSIRSLEATMVRR